MKTIADLELNSLINRQTIKTQNDMLLEKLALIKSLRIAVNFWERKYMFVADVLFKGWQGYR